MISSENGLLRGSVLMSVRGRDVGRFVDEAQRAVAHEVKMTPGYYIEWSGQYEKQISAKKRLELVIPLLPVALQNLRLFQGSLPCDPRRTLRVERRSISPEAVGKQITLQRMIELGFESG